MAMDAENNTEYLLYASLVSPRYYLEFGSRGKALLTFTAAFRSILAGYQYLTECFRVTGWGGLSYGREYFIGT